MSHDDTKDDVIDIEPQVIEEPQGSPAAKRNFGPAKIAGLCVAVGVLGALGGGWLYRDYLATYLPSDQLQAMQARIDALDAASKDNQKRADALVNLTEELKTQAEAAQTASEKNTKGNADIISREQGNAQAISDLRRAMDQASQTVDALKAQVANAAPAGGGGTVDPALAARVDQLEKDVAALKSAPAQATSVDVAAVQQAFDGLKAKIDLGASYAPEFASVQKLAPAAADLDVIGAESDKGLPNAQQLAAELKTLAAQLPQPVAAPVQNNSWIPDISGYISSLVTVKTIGESDAPAVASQALAALQANDLQKASDALSSATEPLPAAFNDWQDRVKRRLKLEQAVAALGAGISRLPGAKG